MRMGGRSRTAGAGNRRRPRCSITLARPAVAPRTARADGSAIRPNGRSSVIEHDDQVGLGEIFRHRVLFIAWATAIGPSDSCSCQAQERRPGPRRRRPREAPGRGHPHRIPRTWTRKRRRARIGPSTPTRTARTAIGREALRRPERRCCGGCERISLPGVAQTYDQLHAGLITRSGVSRRPRPPKSADLGSACSPASPSSADRQPLRLLRPACGAASSSATVGATTDTTGRDSLSVSNSMPSGRARSRTWIEVADVEFEVTSTENSSGIAFGMTLDVESCAVPDRGCHRPA